MPQYLPTMYLFATWVHLVCSELRTAVQDPTHKFEKQKKCMGGGEFSAEGCRPPEPRKFSSSQKLNFLIICICCRKRNLLQPHPTVLAYTLMQPTWQKFVPNFLTYIWRSLVYMIGQLVLFLQWHA